MQRLLLAALRDQTFGHVRLAGASSFTGSGLRDNRDKTTGWRSWEEQRMAKFIADIRERAGL
jgi:hypothetical protein